MWGSCGNPRNPLPHSPCHLPPCAQVIFGSFFLLNLALAVLYLNFSKDKEARKKVGEEAICRGGGAERAVRVGVLTRGACMGMRSAFIVPAVCARG